MGFLENICRGLGIEADITPCDFRYSVFGKYGGHFEGVKTLKSFGKEEVIIIIKDGEIKITGKNLSIRKYCENEVALNGEITEVKKI